MTPEQLELLVDMLGVLFRIAMRHSSPAEQVELLQQWQEFYDGLVVRSD